MQMRFVFIKLFNSVYKVHEMMLLDFVSPRDLSINMRLVLQWFALAFQNVFTQKPDLYSFVLNIPFVLFLVYYNLVLLETVIVHE